MPILLLFLAAALAAPPQEAGAGHNDLARDILRELIEIDTTDASGDTTKAARAMEARLLQAGFSKQDVTVLGPDPRKGNLVARLRGAGAGKPILLLAHLDVVAARREDWSFDPFRLTERDGYFYGRGTSDDKDMAAIWIANLLRWKRENFRPARDLIVALTADEEGGKHNGVDWLIKNHRSLIDADFCLNEGGGGQIKNGKYLLLEVQASEKVYVTFQLEVKSRGGHSSRPVRDNAIYHLAEGLARLADFQFPVRLNEVTRAFFQKMAEIEPGPLAADMRAVARAPADIAAARRLSASPYYNALLRTTCVATQLNAGHAENALPQMARATVNCRLLPDDTSEEVQKTLVKVLANDRIAVSVIEPPKPSPASPLRPDVMRGIEKASASLWPGIPVVPLMSTGSTDGLFLRAAAIPTYGVSGVFADIDDVRAHGKDERIGVKQFYEAREFLYRLVSSLAE